jgi:ribosomal-protein-alanine N-acetyltransferase
MLIEFGDTLLRDWQPEDAPALAGYADNVKIWANLRDAFPRPYTLKDARAFIARVNAARPQTVFAIATRSEAIGSIGLMPGRDVHRYTAELGYWLAEPFWGLGIMTRAVEALVDYAFRELKLHRIYAEPYCSNPASARVLEKAGFTYEGIMRANAYKQGKILDQALYAVVSEENTLA